MALSFLYRLVRRVLEVVRVHWLDAAAKDAEILVLRHQPAVVCRQVARPRFTWSDRALVALLAGLVPRRRWRSFLVTPQTILGWHRSLVKKRWTYPHRRPRRPALSEETVKLICRLARENLCVPNIHPTRSCDESILVNEAAENRIATYLGEIGIVARGWRDPQGPRRLLIQRVVRAMIAVVSDVLGQSVIKMSSSEDQESIGALSANGSNESLNECVRSWRSNGCLDNPDAFGPEYLVETGGELRISVPDQSGFESMRAKDCPHARWGEPDSHSGQLALDPPITPGRVLSCHTKDQRNRYRWNRRSSGRAVRAGPIPSHEILMPPQQGLRLDKETFAASS
jgi:hypothetical protein